MGCGVQKSEVLGVNGGLVLDPCQCVSGVAGGDFFKGR